MQSIPPLDGLSWSKIRALSKELAGKGSADEVAIAAERELVSPDYKRRMLGVYLLGVYLLGVSGQAEPGCSTAAHKVPGGRPRVSTCRCLDERAKPRDRPVPVPMARITS